MENLYNNHLNIQNNQNQKDEEDEIQTSDERKSKIMFNEIIEDFIRKKTTKENEHKNQIEKNKKNLLEKFYSLSNLVDSMNNPKEENIDNIQNNNMPTTTLNIKNNQPNLKEKESNNNAFIKNINIPNNINPNLIPDGQKEYEEIKEKYKNERNKKKSSIFKSEDLRISNTNSVHLKKEDFSPINPNIVNQETKNNILIIQKKLFGDSEINEETSKVENIDEIDDLDFEDLNIKEFKNEDNSNAINNNIRKTNNSNSNLILSNLDTNNINFDLSSNLKSEINENENNYFFPNEILVEERAVNYFYYGSMNKKDMNNKYDIFKDYKKIINRAKNFSVQLVSKLDYIEDENKNNYKNKNRKVGSNQEVMNEMNNFIKNLIPDNLNDNNLGNKFNRNEFNYGFDKINNNININNINNNININDANLAKIISQQQLKPKINTNNNKKNNIRKNNIINFQNNDFERHFNSNNINKNSNFIKKNNNNNYNTKINRNSNNNIINKIQKQLQKENKIKSQQNYKKIMISQKPILNNVDLNLNENIQKAKTKIRLNYRHISNSNITQMNKNSTNIKPNNQTLNNIRHKRKNNSVIIKRDKSKENNKDIYLLSNNINNNKIKDKKKFYHYNTNINNNLDSRTNSNLNELNSLKNNIKNIISQIPSLCKNPMTTKNKKISMSKMIKNKMNMNNLNNSNEHNNNGINNSNSNQNTNSNSGKIKKKSNNNMNLITSNKFSILNTLHKNNIIKYAKLTQKIEAINKLKQYSYLGIYFIFAEKINEGFLFKGIYKRGPSEIHHICNKIYGIQNTPGILNYEKFLIFVENNKNEFNLVKLSSINIINYSKTILLVRNE